MDYEENAQEQTQRLDYLTTDEVRREFGFDPREVTLLDPKAIRSKLLLAGEDRMVRMWLRDDCVQVTP